MIWRFLMRKLSYAKHAHAYIHEDIDAQEASEPNLTASLAENIGHLREFMGKSSDLKVHGFSFGPDGCLQGAVVFIDGLVNGIYMTEAILRPLAGWVPDGQTLNRPRQMMKSLAEQAVCAGEMQLAKSCAQLAEGCMNGDTVLLAEGCPEALVISTKGWDKRGVTEPQSESVVRGPREGFTENLRTNTALIRRKIKSEKLRVEQLTVGRRTKTSVCLMYLDGVADQQVVEQLKYRITRIEVDAILETGYIEEYIEDAPFSPFNTINYTEKPDVAAGRILEGRVAVVVDGTPFVLTVPMLFVECFQTAEDYYTRPFYASMTRVIRFIAYILAVFGPAVYIALTSFHQEMIPTTLLFTIAGAREGTPFPAFVEALIMVFAFEILREGGIRMPRPVGQAISIVGALVMGDAAVSAGIVGAPMVITVAITAVASFLVQSQNEAISIMRLAMMCLAAFAGFYGVAMGTMAVLFHLATLTSFGTPYFDGFAWTRNLQDSLVRMPLWYMIKRPKGIAKGDTTRLWFFIPPLRPFDASRREREEENQS